MPLTHSVRHLSDNHAKLYSKMRNRRGLGVGSSWPTPFCATWSTAANGGAPSIASGSSSRHRGVPRVGRPSVGSSSFTVVVPSVTRVGCSWTCSSPSSTNTSTRSSSRTRPSRPPPSSSSSMSVASRRRPTGMPSSSLPCKRRAADQLYLVCSMLAHNLSRELQMRTAPKRRGTKPIGPAIFELETLGTIRDRLLRRADRLTNP